MDRSSLPSTTRSSLHSSVVFSLSSKTLASNALLVPSSYSLPQPSTHHLDPPPQHLPHNTHPLPIPLPLPLQRCHAQLIDDRPTVEGQLSQLRRVPRLELLGGTPSGVHGAVGCGKSGGVGDMQMSSHTSTSTRSRTTSHRRADRRCSPRISAAGKSLISRLLQCLRGYELFAYII